MINVYDVHPKTGKLLSWDQFYGNLSQLMESIDDREHSVVMCRDLPPEWEDSFRALGDTDERAVAWVRFQQGEGKDEFFFAFIAWDEEVLINYVNHIGEEVMGGTMTQFEKREPRTLH